MKINSFRIKNFKSLYDTPASKFSEINMLFGLNNSGKSNVLYFLNMLFKSKTFGQQVRVGLETQRQETYTSDFWEGEVTHYPFIFFDNITEKPIEFEITLEIHHDELQFKDLLIKDKIITHNRDFSYVFFLGRFTYVNKTTSRILLQEIQINNKSIFKDGKFISYKTLNEEHLVSILQQFNDCILILDSDRILEYSKPKENSSYFSPSSFRDDFFNLYLYDFDVFTNLLKSISEFKLNDKGQEILKNHIFNSPLEKPEVSFTRFNDSYELMLKNVKGSRHPLINYGSGIQQLFYILVRIFNTSAKIILIEELELNLSPLYQLELIKFINNEIKKTKGKKIHQLIFTSHSKYFCKRTDLLSVFEVVIDNKGKSTISKANKNRLNNYFERNYY